MTDAKTRRAWKSAARSLCTCIIFNDDGSLEKHKKDCDYRILRDALAASEAENAELKQSFDLYYAAEMRGIKRWQEATGKDMVWPDAGKLSAWLLERLAASEARVEALERTGMVYDESIKATALHWLNCRDCKRDGELCETGLRLNEVETLARQDWRAALAAAGKKP